MAAKIAFIARERMAGGIFFFIKPLLRATRRSRRQLGADEGNWRAFRGALVRRGETEFTGYGAWRGTASDATIVTFSAAW